MSMRNFCPRCKCTKLQDPIEKNPVTRHDKKTHICCNCNTEEFLISKKVQPLTRTESEFVDSISPESEIEYRLRFN